MLEKDSAYACMKLCVSVVCVCLRFMSKLSAYIFFKSPFVSNFLSRDVSTRMPTATVCVLTE